MLEMTITPRLADTDGLRHINNLALPAWFETARNPIFRIFIPGLELERWNLIMAHLEVDFHAQLYFQHEVLIKTGVSKIGNSSFTVYQEAWQHGARCASGSVVIIHFDFATNKSVPLTSLQRAELEKIIVEPQGR